MIVDSIALSDFEVFSRIDRDLNLKGTTLSDFMRWTPKLETFKDILKTRSAAKKGVVATVLKQQYASIPGTSAALDQIEKLKAENTFTVCTAHQPSLFGGPLFVISKALSTIKLARQIQDQNPTYTIIPFFVIGSEDHDVEELNHTYVNGQKIAWNTTQKGPVGRFNNEGLETCIEELKNLLPGNEHDQKSIELTEAAYSKEKTFGQSFQYLLATLFAEYGLLVLNTDHVLLKHEFVPFIKHELLESVSKNLVLDTQHALASRGYEAASYARDINLFYLDNGYRERIERENGTYKIAGLNIEVNANDFIKESEEHPERFSPNVILRPLYQEVLLPNLAYVGGGGELAYWLERKNQFEKLGIDYPMLVRRDSFLIATGQDANQMKEYHMTISDLAIRSDVMVNELAERLSKSDLNLQSEESEILKWMDQIKEKAIVMDPTLGATVEGEKNKLQKSIEYIEKKLLKSEKQKLEVQLNRAKKLKEKLMPEGNLTERKENFMTYYSIYGQKLFDVLLQDFNPLDFQFKMIVVE